MKLDEKIVELWQAARLCGKNFGKEDSKCGDGINYCEHHLAAKEAAEAIQLMLNTTKDANPVLLHSGGRIGKKK